MHPRQRTGRVGARKRSNSTEFADLVLNKGMDLARAWAVFVIVVTCVAAASPVVPELRGRKGDSFPLSWYPMFAKERPAKERPTYVFGVGPGGERVKVDVSYWTTGGFNQGRNELTTTVKAGDAALDAMCARIASRVVKKNRRELRQVTELRIATGTYDRERYFSGDRAPIKERILGRCPVERPPPEASG